MVIEGNVAIDMVAQHYVEKVFHHLVNHVMCAMYSFVMMSYHMTYNFIPIVSVISF